MHTEHDDVLTLDGNLRTENAIEARGDLSLFDATGLVQHDDDGWNCGHALHRKHDALDICNRSVRPL